MLPLVCGGNNVEGIDLRYNKALEMMQFKLCGGHFSPSVLPKMGQKQQL